VTGVGRTALGLVPLALLARGSAFAVTIALALWFGVDRATDAYFYAVAFPVFALVIFTNAIGIALTPALARVLERAPAEAESLVGSVCTWGVALGLALGTLVCLGLPPVLPGLTAFDAWTLELTERFLWELLPYMALTPVSAALRVGCEVRGAFRSASLAPAVRALATILGTGALLVPAGPDAMPLGLVVGELAQVAWLWGVLAWSGLVVRPTARRSRALGLVARDTLPILGAEVMVASNLVVDKVFAGTLDTGAVATLEYADRARVIPRVLLASTLMPVAYAAWSHMQAREQEGFGHAVDQSLRWVAALSAPVLAGMFIARVLLVRWLFERGEFTAADTWLSAEILRWYLPGVWPLLLGTMAIRAHVIRGRLWLVFWLGVGSAVHNAGWNLALMGPMGLEGIALATTVNMFVIQGLLLWLLRTDLAAEVSAVPWLPVGAIAGLSVLVAAAVEWQVGPPLSVTAPALWLAGVACTALLVLAFRVTGPSVAIPGRSAGS